MFHDCYASLLLTSLLLNSVFLFSGLPPIYKHSTPDPAKPEHKAAISSPAYLQWHSSLKTVGVSSDISHSGLSACHSCQICPCPWLPAWEHAVAGLPALSRGFLQGSVLQGCAISLQADTWHPADPCQTTGVTHLPALFQPPRETQPETFWGVFPYPHPNSRLIKRKINFLWKANVGSTTVI